MESDASAVEHLAEMKAEQLKAQEMLSGSSAFWEMLLTADLTHDLHLDPVLYLGVKLTSRVVFCRNVCFI